MLSKEELDGIDISDVGTLPRVVFFDEECGSLNVVVGGGELTKNIVKKKKPDVL